MGGWGGRYCAGNQDFVVGANAQQQAVQIEGGDLKNCLALGVEVYRDQLDSIGSTADPDMTAPCTKC